MTYFESELKLEVINLTSRALEHQAKKMREQIAKARRALLDSYGAIPTKTEARVLKAETFFGHGHMDDDGLRLEVSDVRANTLILVSTAAKIPGVMDEIAYVRPKSRFFGSIPDPELPNEMSINADSIVREVVTALCSNQQNDLHQYDEIFIVLHAAGWDVDSQHLRKGKTVPHERGESDTPLSLAKRSWGNKYIKSMNANVLTYITGGEGRKASSQEEKKQSLNKAQQGEFPNKNPRVTKENIPMPGKHVTWADNPGIHVYLQQEKQKILTGIPTTFNLRKSKKSIEGERKKIPLSDNIPAATLGNYRVDLR
jgi:hypothetical protein